MIKESMYPSAAGIKTMFDVNYIITSAGNATVSNSTILKTRKE